MGELDETWETQIHSAVKGLAHIPSCPSTPVHAACKVSLGQMYARCRLCIVLCQASKILLCNLHERLQLSHHQRNSPTDTRTEVEAAQKVWTNYRYERNAWWRGAHGGGRYNYGGCLLVVTESCSTSLGGPDIEAICALCILLACLHSAKWSRGKTPFSGAEVMLRDMGAITAVVSHCCCCYCYSFQRREGSKRPLS